MIQYEAMRKLLEENKVYRDALNQHRARALNPTHPHLRGTSQGPDIFFQLCEASNPYYQQVPEHTKKAMEDVAALTGRKYHLFDYVGAADADRVVIIMGGGSPVVEEVVNHLNAQKQKVGLVKVRLYRPWSGKDLVDAVPKTAKHIAVLDRTKEPGSSGEPLYLDVVMSFAEAGALALFSSCSLLFCLCACLLLLPLSLLTHDTVFQARGTAQSLADASVWAPRISLPLTLWLCSTTSASPSP